MWFWTSRFTAIIKVDFYSFLHFYRYDPEKKEAHPYSMDEQERTKSMEHEIVLRCVAAAQKDAQAADALVRQNGK